MHRNTLVLTETFKLIPWLRRCEARLMTHCVPRVVWMTFHHTLLTCLSLLPATPTLAELHKVELVWKSTPAFINLLPPTDHIRNGSEMQSSTVIYLTFLLWALLPLKGVQTALVTRTASESILQGGEAVQFLWQQVQQGTFYKRLPPAYAHDEDAWWDFLHTRAEPLIHSYYS